MQLKRATSAPVLIAASVILLVCLLEIFQVRFLHQLELHSYDARVKMARSLEHKLSSATNLAFVEINDQTIASINNGLLGQKYGLYWPRHIYGRALKELSTEGAKAVAFDVMFGERRNDHAPVMMHDGSEIGSDEFFARELSASGNAILAADKDLMPHRYFRTNAWSVANITVQRDSDGVLRRDQPFKDYRLWHPFVLQLANEYNLDLARTVLETNKIIFARKRDDKPLIFSLDNDGRMQTAELENPVQPNHPANFLPFTTYRAWSLGIVLAARELGLDLENPTITAHKIILNGTNGITRTIPVGADGTFYIEWSLPVNDPRLTEGSLEELLICQQYREQEKPIQPEWQNRFANKLVVIGSTATGNDLADLGATPLNKETFLVSKHWNVANSIITGRFIKQASVPFTLALIIVLGAASAWITWQVSRPFLGTLLVATLWIVYIVVAAVLYLQYRYWLPIIMPMLCSASATHVATVTYRSIFEQSERKRIKSVFSKVVSPVIVNELLKTEGVRVDGVRRRITVYFADVRGFTELTDTMQQQADAYLRDHKLSPEEAETYLSEQARETLNTVSTYLSIIADTIKQRNGTFDKYIGDCVMAFWGAPISNPRHAVDCVMAAIDAQRGLAAINVQRKAENVRRTEENVQRAAMNLPALPLLPVLSMGSGINTGQAVVGEMGSAEQTNYTVFGREVNLASRLEGVSGHGRIIIGESTYLDLKQHEPTLAATCIELPPHEVKGFRTAVKIYEVPWKTDSDTATQTRTTLPQATAA
ncbi:MAG: CHASE2 domain-containing protein [Limisphaerales bacterium]